MISKKNIVCSILLFLVQTTFGQIVSPVYRTKKLIYCDILKIEQTSSNTTVYFKYTAPSFYNNGGTVCISSNIFIRDVRTKAKFKFIRSNNIPVCPNQYKFQYDGQTLEFSIIFESIPRSISEIDIIEDESFGEFNFWGVILSNTSIANPSNSKSNSTTIERTSCDKITNVPPTPKPSFENMLAGVKYATIISKPKINAHLPPCNAHYEYLKEMGFEVRYLSENIVKPDHLCEEIFVDVAFDYNFENYYNIRWYFLSACQNYIWDFSTDKIVNGGLYSDPKTGFYNVLREMYQYKKPSFNSNFRIELPRKQTCWTEDMLKNYIKEHGCDNLEGIYECVSKNSLDPKYRIFVRKIDEIYYLIYLSGATNTGNWIEGEIKATLEPTATQYLYKAKWVMADKTENSNYYVNFETGSLNVLSGEDDKSLYIKLFPSSAEKQESRPLNSVSSGTGYAISSNGFIVTNHHVTDDASSIKIRGVNGDFSRAYSAKVVVEDRNNDLSILKINDPTFVSMGEIPYTISRVVSEVGTSVFVLGYPLRATMGDEVKLTDGIISSRSGFQGDITSYQITAPIQPGNSGGPLFDKKGNIIGIINAKHALAENATYAIKTSYLLNLLESMPNPPKLQTINSVAGKTLTEQVKLLKKFVFIVEVEK